MGNSSSKKKKAAAAKAAASTADPATIAAAAAAPTATTSSSTFTAGDRVTTFAGAGTVCAADGGMVTVTLDWKLAQGQGATAHFNDASVTLETPAAASPADSSSTESVTPATDATLTTFFVGARCGTFAGPGTVDAMRGDGLVKVTLDWKLAQGQGATAYFTAATVRLLLLFVIIL